MSFISYTKSALGRGARRAVSTVTVGPGDKAGKFYRVALAGDVWNAGGAPAFYNISVGTNSDFGKIMLTPSSEEGGGYKVLKAGKVASARYVCLNRDAMPYPLFQRARCNWKIIGDGSIIITLPGPSATTQTAPARLNSGQFETRTIPQPENRGEGVRD